MTQTPIIGIVGGVGPYAGLDIVQKIFDQTIANSDQDHLPVAMLSLSEQILDRTEYLEGRVKENPGYALAQVLLKLEQIGAEVAGIPCNTAHAPQIFQLIEAELLKNNSQLKLFHLIEECIKYIQNRYADMKSIGVLSTTGTWRFRLYTDLLQSKGLTPIVPTEQQQHQVVHPAIYDPNYGIKAQSFPVSARAKNDLLQAIRDLRAKGAEAIILGCTELPLAFQENSVEGIPLIDPTRILAQALIKEVAPEKLKNVQVKIS